MSEKSQPGRLERAEGAGVPLWFGLLGPMAVRGVPADVISARALKSRMVLALLLLEPSRVVSRDRIEAVLWGDDPPTTARASLTNYIVQLRNAFRVLGHARLRTVPTGYLLEVQPGELDTLDFGRILSAAQAARERGDHATVISQTNAALALWRDEPFADLPELSEVAEPYAAHLRESRLLALEWRLDAGLELGLPDHAFLELNRLVAEHPLREAFHRQLMLAHHRSGRQADALMAFERARIVFAEELGVDPGRELRDLHHSILVGDPDPAGGSAAGARGRQLGTAPPLPIPSQLPGTIADFCGRGEEAARLCALLTASPESPAPVIAAITGVGGCGKTTLALHVAHRVAAQFPDGQLFVDLRGADAAPLVPGEVLADLLRALGVPDADVPADHEARAALYRSVLSGRRILVVLDNARDAAQLRPLLPGSVGCAVLATSRRTLAALAGTTRLGLAALPDAEAHALFGAITGTQRIAAEPAATSQVLTVCGGLPLALRIAAARLAARPSWSVGTLAAKLADQHRRLDELRAEDLAVRASFRLSYDSLPEVSGPGEPDPGRAFRILGLVPSADISLAAAAAALGRSETHAEEELEHLVDVGLLESPAPDRYHQHDLLRLFAGERAAREESEDARREAVRRVAEWYLRTLTEADAVLFPGADRPDRLATDGRCSSPGFDFDTALSWCDTERSAITALPAVAAQYGLHHIAWRITAFAWGYFNHRSHFQDWLTTAETGLLSARACGDIAAEAAITTSRGAVLMCLEQMVDAQAALTQALALLEQTDCRPTLMRCLSNLGAVLHRQEQYGQAKEYYLRALGLAGDPRGRHQEVILLVNLAHVETENGFDHTALEYLDRADSINLELGDRALATSILKMTGRAMIRLGRASEAETPLRHAVAMARSARQHANEAMCGLFLAQALAGTGQWDEATSRFREAQALVPYLSGWEARMARADLAETAAVLRSRDPVVRR